MWQNRLFELKYETCDEDPAHTSMQARRGGPSCTPPGVRGSVSSPHSAGGDQALLFVLVSLEPVGLSWILYTHVILSHHSGHLENTGSLGCAHVNTVHYTWEKSAGRRHRALIWKVPVQDGSPRPRCRRLHVYLTVVVMPRLQAPLPHQRPRLPPSRGVCPLIGERGLDKPPLDLCAAVSSPSVGAPCTPHLDPFCVCVLALAQPIPFSEFFLFALVQLLCCCCRLPETRLTALLSLRLPLFSRWVWTASPPSVSRVSSLPLERSRSTLLRGACCAAKHTSHADTRIPPLGSAPAAPAAHRALPVSLLCGSPLPSCVRDMFTAQSSAPSLNPGVSVVSSLLSLLWFVFSCCFAGLVIIYWILDTVTEKAMAPHSSTLACKSHGQRSLVGCSPWGC